MRTTLLALGCLLAFAGCGGPDEHTPAGGAPPIQGGTLELTEVDGRQLAVASDPARSSIYVVDVTRGAEAELHRVLVPDAEPGRIAPAGSLAYVVLRRTGEVATLDVSSGEILERRHACESPRGIDTDPDTGDLWVACAEGALVRMPPADGGVSQRIPLPSDLRDVVARPGGEQWVTRFRAAEVLVIRDGEMVGDPMPIPGVTPLSGFAPPLPEDPSMPATPTFDATVAWRMRDVGGGRVMIVHQLSQATSVNGESIPSQPEPTPPSYGGGGGFDQCSGGGVIRSAFTFFDGRGFTTRTAASTTLAVDGDIRGNMVALAAASEPDVAADEANEFTPRVNGVRGMTLDGSSTDFGGRGPEPGFVDDNCVPTSQNFDDRRPAVAVVSLGDGRFLAQYRDPGELMIGTISAGTLSFDGFGPVTSSVTPAQVRVPLTGGSVEDSGHALFHEATPSGATCASCHPGGGDDGHTWLFSFGPRRSQSLRGGILETAPFHWNGEHSSLAAVFDDTFVQRMGGATAPRGDEVDSFERWIDAVPSAPGQLADAERIDRGEQVFRDAGCDTCHGASALRMGATGAIVTDWDVPFQARTHEFQAPKLHDVLLRGPYLHDGSAETLEEAVLAMPDADQIPDAAMDDLLAYLRSI